MRRRPAITSEVVSGGPPSNRTIAIGQRHGLPSKLFPLAPESLCRTSIPIFTKLNHAIDLQRQGRLADAEAVYSSILATDPREPNALRLLGALKLQADDLDAAEKLLTKALRINRSPDTLYFLGAALLRRGSRPEARRHLTECLRLDPRHVQALETLGCLASEQGGQAEAIDLLTRLVRIAPASASGYYNLGLALASSHRIADALQAYDCALALWPDFANALTNSANLLLALGRFDDAIARYARARAAAPGDAAAILNLGQAYMQARRFGDAVTCFSGLLESDPGHVTALGLLVYCRMQNCDWPGLEAQWHSLLERLRSGAAAAKPLALLSIPCTEADQFACAAREAGRPAAAPLLKWHRVATDRRLKLAYVSWDFHEHPVSFLLAGVIEHHDRDRFDITAISLRDVGDSPMRTRLKAAFGSFVDAHANSDDDIVALMRAAHIDIAVDLNGHTHGNRMGVFARRSAPIQVNFLGFAGTSGAPFMDYLIADRTSIPDASRQYYSETIVDLPHSFMPFDDSFVLPAGAPTRGEAGLPEAGFVFCCFNQAAKITPESFGVWMQILAATPGSVLWLTDNGSAVTEHLRREAVSRGVAAERLIFAPRLAESKDHLLRQRAADLFLDTFHYNAHTSAMDALSVGLPVLSKLGDSFAGRVGASLVRAAGLPELVVRSVADYQALAVRLANDPAALAAIKRRLADNRAIAPLFDTACYTRDLEAAYIAMGAAAQ